jgi:methionyl aminopeptidase
VFRPLRGVELKTPEQLQRMRRAGLVVSAALTATARQVRAGVTTAELDAVAADVIRSRGASPSFLGYHGYPAVTCISVNSEIVHGIPGPRALAAGDLVSIDCGAVVDGWHGDAAVTVGVGQVAPEAAALSDATRTALSHGIAAARLGGYVADISRAVQTYVRSLPTPYGIVAEYVGHGIGSAMHQPPDVPNLAPGNRMARGPRIVPGLALAIEPMLTAGSPDNSVLDDDWTVVTDDGSLACHWEHTITVTERGVWVLTAEDGGEEMLANLGAPFGPL